MQSITVLVDEEAVRLELPVICELTTVAWELGEMKFPVDQDFPTIIVDGKVMEDNFKFSRVNFRKTYKFGK